MAARRDRTHTRTAPVRMEDTVSNNKTADLRMTPATLAALMQDAPDAPHGLGLGRKWTVSDGAKRVRSIARDHVDRFVNRTGRTMHAYTVDEARAIVAEARRATGGGTGADADTVRAALAPASTPRPARKGKGKGKTPASTPDAASGPQDAAE